MDINNNSEGIFILNGQVFLVNDLISVIRRQGIRITINRNGLSIDGEHISSISDLNDNNSCPLARICEKRVGLIEFLKLQKSNRSKENNPETHFSLDSSLSLVSRGEPQREEAKRGFIKPNNHDLFEGNIEPPVELFDESEDDLLSFFENPDLFSDISKNDFEEPKSQEQDYPERARGHDSQFFEREEYSNTREIEELFCPSCGIDINPLWNTCPKCGEEVKRKIRPKSDRLFL